MEWNARPMQLNRLIETDMEEVILDEEVASRDVPFEEGD